MQDVFVDTGDVNDFISSIKGLLVRQADEAMESRANITSLTDHMLVNLSSSQYEGVRSDLLGAWRELETTMRLSVSQQNYTDLIEVKYSILNVSDILLYLDNIRRAIGNLGNLSEDISMSLPGISSDKESIVNATSLANSSLLASEVTIARTQMLLFLAGGDIQALAQTTGDSPNSDTSGSGSGTGSGITPDMTSPVLPMDVDSISNGLSSLRRNAQQLAQMVLVHDDVIRDAANTSLILEAADMINR
jgi:hypothetical protein